MNIIYLRSGTQQEMDDFLNYLDGSTDEDSLSECDESPLAKRKRKEYSDGAAVVELPSSSILTKGKRKQVHKPPKSDSKSECDEPLSSKKRQKVPGKNGKATTREVLTEFPKLSRISISDPAPHPPPPLFLMHVHTRISCVKDPTCVHNTTLPCFLILGITSLSCSI